MLKSIKSQSYVFKKSSSNCFKVCRNQVKSVSFQNIIEAFLSVYLLKFWLGSKCSGTYEFFFCCLIDCIDLKRYRFNVDGVPLTQSFYFCKLLSIEPIKTYPNLCFLWSFKLEENAVVKISLRNENGYYLTYLLVFSRKSNW